MYLLERREVWSSHGPRVPSHTLLVVEGEASQEAREALGLRLYSRYNIVDLVSN